jgi:hypothetical protein
MLMARNGFRSNSSVVMYVQYKVNTSYQFSGWAGTLLLAVTLNIAADDQIKVYTVPKEHPAMQPAQAMPLAGAPDIPVNAAPIRWTLPAGWEDLKPSDGRHFTIKGANGGSATVAITSFPGSVGTELDNVNRWRRELSLEPVGPSDVASEPVTVDSLPGKLYEFAGEATRTVVADIPRNGSSWFIKLRGDSAVVAAAKPVFLEFLKSVHFGGDSAEAASIGVAPTAADPHAGLNLPGVPSSHGGLATPDASSDMPKWNAPSQWVETAPGPMVFKRFSVADDAGGNAAITVSFLSGQGGGVLLNVNRWRGQLGQPPIEQGQLDGVTELLATAEGKTTLVDFMGADAKTGQPARLVAAIVPQGDKTWFYKLMGSGKVVGEQKDSFVQFVKTVHYP